MHQWNGNIMSILWTCSEKQSMYSLQCYLLLYYEVQFPIGFLICWRIVGGCIIRNITMTRSWLLLSATLMQYQHYPTLIITHHANMTTHRLIPDQPIIIFTLVSVTCAINFGVGKLAKLNYSNLVCEQMVWIDTKTAEIMNISIESWERCCWAMRGTNLNIALGKFG